MEVRKPEFDPDRAPDRTMMSDADAFGASRVGAELRAARLRLGWSLEDVASGLRIRLPFLEAIEEGRIADLPGAAYAVGFVRTYAQALGLDPDEVSRRFRAESKEVNRKTELTFPAPVPQRGVPAGAVILLGLVVAIGAYVAWYKVSAVRHDDVAPPVPERLAPLADRTPAANTLSPQVASVLPPPAPPGSSPLVAPQPAQTAPLPPVAAIPVPVPVPVTMTPTPALTAAPAPATLAPDASRVVLKFKADSYVQVREKQGAVLLNRVMRAGDVWSVPNQPNLVMTTGNAGGTDVVVDGINAAPLGGNGVVRRDIPLDPAAIKLPPGVKLPAQPRAQ